MPLCLLTPLVCCPRWCTPCSLSGLWASLLSPCRAAAPQPCRQAKSMPVPLHLASLAAKQHTPARSSTRQRRRQPLLPQQVACQVAQQQRVSSGWAVWTAARQQQPQRAMLPLTMMVSWKSPMMQCHCRRNQLAVLPLPVQHSSPGCSVPCTSTVWCGTRSTGCLCFTWQPAVQVGLCQGVWGASGLPGQQQRKWSGRLRADVRVLNACVVGLTVI